MKRIFFLMAALLVGLFLAQVCYATAELIWDNSPSWVASKYVTSFAVRSGDLNNDGFPDIVQADYYGQIYIYYNNAGQLPLTPSWTSSVPLTYSWGGGFFDVQLADINSDGFLDIIATKEYDGKVYVFFNHNGQFNLQADWISNPICSYAGRIIKPVDIDGDGDIDLLVQCAADSLNLLKNNAGALTKNPVWSSSERYVVEVQFDVADYDNDGIMEVAIPNGYEGSGSFPHSVNYPTFVYKYNFSTEGFDVIWKSPPESYGVVKNAYWADYDNDGDLDLITSAGKVFINTNGVLSSTPIVFYQKPSNVALFGMAVGDYNNDGLIDVILTTYDNKISYFENSPNGLILRQRINVSPIIVWAGNIDYDLDGDTDILLTYFGPAMIYSNRFVENNNHTPLANAGTDQTVSCSGSNGTAVTLNGSGSSDPDGDALTYIWTGIFGTAAGVNPQVQIPLGTYTVTLKVDDGKGGTAEDTVNITVADKTPPSTSAAITGTSGNNGWYKSEVNVSLTSADNCSGVKEIHYILDGAETIISGSTAGFTISADGTHSLSFWAVDNANNPETAHPATINIDKTLPAITATATPAANANGWNNTDVTVSFTCADATSGIATCPSPVTVTTEGAGQEISGIAVDNAGNSATTSVTLNIDQTPPTIKGSANETPNEYGWYNKDVNVNFTCSDSLSGIASCEPSVDIPNEGAGQVRTGRAVDKADNSATASVTVNIDLTPPVITATVTPAPNANGWHNADVTVTFTCSDNLSGIASCTAPVTVTTEGAGQEICGTANDNAGNSANTCVTLNIDKTAPGANLSVTPGLLWPPNHKMVNVALNGGSTDTTSQIASIVFTVRDEYGKVEPVVTGFNTTIPLEAWREGTDMDGRLYTITAVITDKAGNVTTVTTEAVCPHDMRDK